MAVQTKKPVTGKTQKLAKNPPKQPAKPLKAAKPPALKSKAVTARVKPGTVRKGIPLSGPAPGETKSQLGFASGVLRRKTVKRTGPGPVATLKAPSPVVKPLKAAKPPALKSKAVTARVKPGTVRKGIPLSGPAPGETKSQLGFASGVLRRKTVKRTGPGSVAHTPNLRHVVQKYRIL